MAAALDGDAGSTSIDPAVPAGIALLPIGGLLLLAAPATTRTSQPQRICGLSGCSDVDVPTGAPEIAPMLVAGGAVTTVGASGLLVLAAVDPPVVATPGRARIAMGGMGLTIGGASLVMGAVGLAGDAGLAPRGLIAAGAVTSAVSAPVLVWGLATTGERGARDTYASGAALGAGTALVAAGATIASGGAAVVATSIDCRSSLSNMCGLNALVGAPVMATGLILTGVGVGLHVAGADLGADVAPQVALGPGSVDLAWRLP